MVHSTALKHVSGQSYKATIRTFGSSLVHSRFFAIYTIKAPLQSYKSTQSSHGKTQCQKLLKTEKTRQPKLAFEYRISVYEYS